MLLASLKDVLVCDVEQFDIKDETTGQPQFYYKAYFYNKRSVIGVSCSKEQANHLAAFIGKFVSFECEANDYNGKVKYKLLPEAEINVKE